MGSELAVLVKDEPVELRVYLRQSDALRVLTTVEDQYFNPRVIVEATSENVNLGDSGYQPRPNSMEVKCCFADWFPRGITRQNQTLTVTRYISPMYWMPIAQSTAESSCCEREEVVRLFINRE